MNEELKKAADEYTTRMIESWEFDSTGLRPPRESFIAGAKWQAKQFEKNRLAACDAQTKEEYDREVDFATRIIEQEHRKPTFNDAINYGMKLQKKQMLKEAVESELYYDGDFLAIDLNMAELGYSERDKVRVIILKEEEQ